MTMYPSSSTQQPAAICALKSPADAIHVLEAVRLGLVPRVTRRLTGHERSMIRPGTVWVWEEEETNMRRWTDGRRWGASRVGGGGFLVYTESSDSMSPPPSRADSPTYNQYYGNGRDGGGAGSNSTPPRRPEPLVKQTYSTSMTHPVTGKTKKFHVVAYSSKRNPQGDGANPLPLPHQLPNLANIKITPGIWPDWETRREEYGARRSGGGPPVGSHVPLPPPAHDTNNGHPHPHAQPHHMPSGPGTPVTATAVPYPYPESYRPPSPIRGSDVPYPIPPPSADGRPPSAPHPAHDYRRGPYSPYDMRPPYPYDMYPPPDKHHPYGAYPPARGADIPPPPGHMPPPDYGYDPRYYDRERGREPDLDPRGRYYPPPHPYYRDPRDMRDFRDERDGPVAPPPRSPANGEPREAQNGDAPRDGDSEPPLRDVRDLPPRDPRELPPRDPRDLPPRDPYGYPYPPRGYPPYPYPPYGAYRDPRDDYLPPPASHLGKRAPDDRASDGPDAKRTMWANRGSAPPPTEEGHARQPSGGSAVSASASAAREEPRPSSRDARPISRGRVSPRDYDAVNLPPIRDVENGQAQRNSRSPREWETRQ